MTASERRALDILARHGPMMPKDFAAKMWPESEAWAHHTKCGPHGVHRGGGMYLAAGGYLGRLRKKGWVVDDYGRRARFLNLYVITPEGRRTLTAALAS